MVSNNNRGKKTRIKKDKLAMFIFCIVSLIFFLFCVIFYGYRLIKYYKIYNPKSETGKKIDLLSTHITQSSSVVYEGDGLYRVNGVYMFKGDVKNNYVYYSGMLWRVVKVNSDNTTEITLDEPINNLMWNSTLTDYESSDVHKYLNDVFLKTLNTDVLKKSMICKDVVIDVSKITCNTTSDKSYVKLLNITDFLNSKTKTTFINDSESLWLSDVSKTGVWYAKGTSISSYEPSETYLIKPVVTLKMETKLLSGDGTKANPYQVEKNEKKLKVGSYVKLAHDEWIVYETHKNSSKLILKDLYLNGSTKYRFDTVSNTFSVNSPSSLAYYLNNSFYNSLSYKQHLVEDTWYTGGYQTSYKDIYEKKVKAKVGLYNIADMKFNLQKNNSYLLTPGEVKKAYVFGKHLMQTTISKQYPIRPAIAIKNLKIKAGEGTESSPYELEV